MKIVDLKRAIDREFEQVKVRFDTMDARFDRMDARFDRMDARTDGMDARFDTIDARFDAVDVQIATEHETSRRYMEILVEQLKAEYRLGFDKLLAIDQRLESMHGANTREHTTFAAVPDNHEDRINALETSSKSDDGPEKSGR